MQENYIQEDLLEIICKYMLIRNNKIPFILFFEKRSSGDILILDLDLSACQKS